MIGQNSIDQVITTLQFIDDFIIFLGRTKLESILMSSIDFLKKMKNINKANHRAV